MTFEEMRSTLFNRLMARGRFWREKAKSDLKATVDHYLLRAEEAEACAAVVAELKEGYVAPLAPDMKTARASRGEGR